MFSPSNSKGHLGENYINMPELFKTLQARPAMAIAPAKIQQIAFLTHQEKLQSERYRRWLKWCQEDESVQLQDEMVAFLAEGAIRSISHAPLALRPALKFAEDNGFQFDLQAFAATIDRELFEEKGKAAANKTFLHTLQNLEDQLVAQAIVGRAHAPDFDQQKAILTLELMQTVASARTKDLDIQLDRFYGRPIVLPNCFAQYDPCRKRPRSIPHPTAPVSDQRNLDGNPNGDQGCRCDKPSVDDPCNCECDDACVQQNPCCAKITPYVAELFVVRDEIKCYEPAEISYIENIMQSEVRERNHRQLQREEIFIEQEETISTFEERYQQVDERFSIHQEVEKVTKADLSLEVGASFTYNGIVTGLEASGSTTFSSSLARSVTRKNVQDQSKSVINRATSNLQKTVRTLTRRTLFQEIEESNRHLFGGTGGAPADSSRQFYHVDQVRKAQVFSYGNRMMLDVYLPEPSENFKRLLEKEFTLEKPEAPCTNIEEILPENYLYYVQCCGFTDLEAPPKQPPTKTIYITVDETSGNPAVNIPAGYTAIEIRVVSSVYARKWTAFSRVTFNFGGGSLNHTRPAFGSSSIDGPQTLNPGATSGTALMDTVNVRRFTMTVGIKLQPDPIDILPWQLQVNALLQEKYEKELEEYEAAKAEFEANRRTKFSQNPFYLSETIKEQLKQAAISYVSCQFYDGNDAMKNRVAGCGLPQMDLEEAEREGKFVRFFEQAFEWKFMSYQLYPYFWGRKCSWADKLGQESPNGLFTKFLQSGYARVALAVRPGFEAYVNYFLAFGRIWGFTGTPPIAGPAFVPIHQEIKEGRDNFNADREGHLIWDPALGLGNNQIALRDNLDYYDLTNPLLPVFDPALAAVDIDRELFINCKPYCIVNIEEDALSGEVIITLDKPLESDPAAFAALSNVQLKWSTGALKIGSAWTFKVPTPLVWLREEKRCLPCYPIDCNE